MKKILLLMLLLLSNLIFCQNTGIQNTSDLPLKEIYKGLKQNEYLKLRLQKTDNALNSAQNLITDQEKAISAGKSLATAKDQIISNLEEIRYQESIAGRERENQFKSDVNILKGNLSLMQIEAKEKQRKRFWGGVKVGAVGTVILGAVAGFLIMNNQ